MPLPLPCRAASAGLSQLGENLRRRAGGRDEFDEKASFLGANHLDFLSDVRGRLTLLLIVASSDVDKRRPSGSRGNDSENDARLRLGELFWNSPL